jgi:uncharacterized membrane protein
MSTKDQLVICTFPDAEQADAALRALHDHESRRPDSHLDNIAVVRRNENGEISFFETREIEEAHSTSSLAMVVGWMLGAAGAILGGPLGPDFGVRFGAYAADDATLRHDVGFPDEVLRRFGEQLHAGSSAILTMATAAQRDELLGELRRLGGELVENSTLSAKMLEAMSSGTA